ncbi:MAG TPA: oligosaccharide flippase family protein [Candidatus Dormibacteraeota bacterium]|nr:oligosaccharide flippase family protein [Candidatus Dormibacteraeota bacterium]
MIVALPQPRPYVSPSRIVWVSAAGFTVVVLVAAAAAHFASLSASVALFGLAGVVLIGITAWRPVIGLAVLALAVPLTAGFGRDTVLPLLRTNEALAACVFVGALLHELDRRGSGRFTGLDLAVGSYAVGAMVVPTLVLFVTHTDADLNVWRTIFGPAQYVVVYWLFSRGALRGRDLVTVLNLTMLASVIAAVVGLMELANVPGVRAFLSSAYPLGGGGEALCQYGACRPLSLLEHASAFGAYALLNYVLALALAAWRHPGFPRSWLATVMAANAVAVVISQTQAAVIGLVVATVLVLWHARRVPRELVPTTIALIVGILIFSTQVSARIEQQFGAGGGTPQSLATRYQYWGDYFFPDIEQHLLVGSGTVISASIPAPLVTFVDNEYLRVAYRAGLIGVALLVIMYVSIAAAGWRWRQSSDPSAGAIGAAAVAAVAVLAVMGTTAEYLTFAGVSQQFWMMIGLLAAVPLLAVAPTAPVAVLGPSIEGRAQLRRAVGMLMQPARRLGPEGAFVRSAAIVFAGNTTARLLGFVFAVVAARLLLPGGYGLFAYALAVAGIASILVLDAPIGLARSLPRLRGDVTGQIRVFTNTVVLVGGVLLLSLLVTVPAGLLMGMPADLVVGLVAIVLGIACFTLYRETKRGQERFVAMMAIFVLANTLELIGITFAGAVGLRSPALFLVLYGASYVAAVVILQPVAPFGVRFDAPAVTPTEVKTLLRFVSPLFLQTAFLTAWLGIDLLLVGHFLGAASTGQYAVAKTLANVFFLIPAAISATLLPQVSRLDHRAVRDYVLRALALTATLTAPAVLLLVLLRGPAITILFGSRYSQAAGPFAVLALGAGIYALYQILEHAWIGRGHPIVDTAATGGGLVTTALLGFVLVPHAGLIGAAFAFTAGAAVQLVMIAGISLLAMLGWLDRDGAHSEDIGDAGGVA